MTEKAAHVWKNFGPVHVNPGRTINTQPDDLAGIGLDGQPVEPRDPSPLAFFMNSLIKDGRLGGGSRSQPENTSNVTMSRNFPTRFRN